MSDTKDPPYNPFKEYLKAREKAARDLEKQMGRRVFGRLSKRQKEGENS
jgi:hypothetical protein